MISFFHTADWHLGQMFHGYDRDHEHAEFLAWLLARLVERRPHALLLAGDVFDTVNPSAIAQRRFYRFLADAHHALPNLQFVLTAGNHDAAARLEAPAALFHAFNIRVVGTVPRQPDGALDPSHFLVPLRGDSDHVEALALAVPFLRPADVPVLADAATPYLDGIRALYHDLTLHAVAQRDALHPGAALLALGHCHLAAGRETLDSERRLVIGGAEALRADTFPADLAYVALGHLHLPQSFDNGRIHYCGSPVPLSFSEQHYPHQVLEVTIDQGRVSSVTPHLVPRSVPLLRLPARSSAPLSELLPALTQLPAAADLPPAVWPYLEINVLDDGPDPTRRRQIESALENKAARLAAIRLHAPARPEGSDASAPGATSSVTPRDAAGLQALDPIALVSEHHRQRYGQDSSPEILACLREILLAAELAGETSASLGPPPSASATAPAPITPTA
jgi:DNA repair protein SbcD/Mre11